jgi:hypothetical protein
MTKPPDAMTTPARSAGATRLYLLLVAAQTVGAALLYWHGLPIYRRLSADVAAYDPQTKTLVWTTAAGALIQLAYWTGYHARLQPPRFVNALLGHVVLFASQLIFLLATAIFLFLFFDKALENRMSISRYVVILFGLFSLFCYTRELARFGSGLLEREGADRTQNQE